MMNSSAPIAGRKPKMENGLARIAKSLGQLRAQVNDLAPRRSKDSDGWIGDPKHAARKSDHNPDHNGVVRAFDITHDPAGGMDAHRLAELLRLHRDPRISYVISAGRIFSSTVQPWKWRTYSGSNSHHRHTHVSVGGDVDNSTPWDLSDLHVFRDIVATTFDDQILAYPDATHSKPGVALPFRFRGKRPRVIIRHKGGSVEADIIDVGPWNTNDPYWLEGGRPQAESGRDKNGRKTNKAGIDLNPAAAKALGLPKEWKGLVDWEFA
jgi:hypothetical protein